MICFLVSVMLAGAGIYVLIAWRCQCRDNRLLHIPAQADVINLGSTYAYYDFDYGDLAVKGGNLANIPQYLDYDLLLLKKYIHKVKKGGKVLIVLPNFVFAGGGTDDDKKAYYEALKPWEMKNFKINHMLKYIWNAVKEPLTHTCRNNELKWKGYVADLAEKKEHAERRVRDWESKLGIPSVCSDYITEELQGRMEKNKNLVLEMITLCRLHSIEPVLIIPPTSGIMHEKVAEACINKYLKLPVYDIAERTGVKILDYMEEEEFLTHDLYMNSDCLNEKGRKIFTKRLLEDLKNK